jgi:hypothetical protein
MNQNQYVSKLVLFASAGEQEKIESHALLCPSLQLIVDHSRSLLSDSSCSEGPSKVGFISCHAHLKTELEPISET